MAPVMSSSASGEDVVHDRVEEGQRRDRALGADHGWLAVRAVVDHGHAARDDRRATREHEELAEVARIDELVASTRHARDATAPRIVEIGRAHVSIATAMRSLARRIRRCPRSAGRCRRRQRARRDASRARLGGAGAERIGMAVRVARLDRQVATQGARYASGRDHASLAASLLASSGTPTSGVAGGGSPPTRREPTT